MKYNHNLRVPYEGKQSLDQERIRNKIWKPDQKAMAMGKANVTLFWKNPDLISLI